MANPQTPLLWIIRDHIGLTGTKFSCGIRQCGACTVHIDGRAICSRSVPASTAVADMHAERLPGEFIETILSGWWTTCLEVLPQKERARGRF